MHFILCPFQWIIVYIFAHGIEMTFVADNLIVEIALPNQVPRHFERWRQFLEASRHR